MQASTGAQEATIEKESPKQDISETQPAAGQQAASEKDTAEANPDDKAAPESDAK